MKNKPTNNEQSLSKPFFGTYKRIIFKNYTHNTLSIHEFTKTCALRQRKDGGALAALKSEP